MAPKKPRKGFLHKIRAPWTLSETSGSVGVSSSPELGALGIGVSSSSESRALGIVGVSSSSEPALGI
eukprot:6193681-Amphidinium_carterae.1